MDTGTTLVTDIDAFFNELYKLRKTGKYIFRGISEDENYLPSLYRAYEKLSIGNEPCSTVEKYERKLLNEFEKYSDDYPSEITTALDWVACGQHYGLPTRFLDWTFNPYYGLFFSLNKKNENYRLLVVKKEKHYFNHMLPNTKPEYPSDIYKSFLMDYKNITKNLSGKEAKAMIGDYDDVPLGMMDSMYLNELDSLKGAETLRRIYGEEIQPMKLLFYAINFSNPRIKAQEGGFQILRFSDAKPIEQQVKNEINNGCEKIYKIHKNERCAILERLSDMNINNDLLFPEDSFQSLLDSCVCIKRMNCDNLDEK